MDKQLELITQELNALGLSETDKAYIAGFVDGEGCISIRKYQGKNNRTPVYTLGLIIINTDEEIMNWIVQVLGKGKLNKYSRGGNWKDTYDLRFNPRDTVIILREILPYLKIKKEQAIIAIEFQGDLNLGNCWGRNTVPLGTVNRRDLCYQKMSELKGSIIKRGRKKMNGNGNNDR